MSTPARPTLPQHLDAHSYPKHVAGWLPRDTGAARLRRKLERCRSLLLEPNGPVQPEWLLPGKGLDERWLDWAGHRLAQRRECDVSEE